MSEVVSAVGRTKAERKLGWGGADTVHFLFKSLYLLSHPCAKLSERARLRVVPSRFLHLRALETELGVQPALPRRSRCRGCLLSHRDTQDLPRSELG